MTSGIGIYATDLSLYLIFSFIAAPLIQDGKLNILEASQLLI